MRAHVGWGLLVAICCARAALAVDGVIEINQARALAGDVTPGDDPGFPVSITSPGSYRLVGDLTLADDNTTGLLVAAPVAQIDLNGFAIRGPHATAGGVSSCGVAGSGRGISAMGGQSIVVSNGGIFGTGAAGIDAGGRSSRIERVAVEQTCESGIRVGEGSLVIDSVARSNKLDGFVLGINSIIQGSVADGNGARGVVAGPGQVSIEHCILNGNEDGGIVAGRASSIRHNQVNANFASGIRVDVGSLVLDNVINGNNGTGIIGATNLAPQVATSGNIVTYPQGGTGFFYDVRLSCNLENGNQLCLP